MLARAAGIDLIRTSGPPAAAAAAAAAAICRALNETSTLEPCTTPWRIAVAWGEIIPVAVRRISSAVSPFLCVCVVLCVCVSS